MPDGRLLMGRRGKKAAARNSDYPEVCWLGPQSAEKSELTFSSPSILDLTLAH
jgi:hypothetical protein